MANKKRSVLSSQLECGGGAMLTNPTCLRLDTQRAHTRMGSSMQELSPLAITTTTTHAPQTPAARRSRGDPHAHEQQHEGTRVKWASVQELTPHSYNLHHYHTRT